VASEPRAFAMNIGLRYSVSGETPGIHRHPWGRGFTYVDDRGRRLSPDHPRRREIQQLAIPPAWRQVWISAWSDGHLQATGHDDADRRQYRYHDLWTRARRDWHDRRLLAFAQALPRLRARIHRTLENADESTRCVVHAAAVRLLDHIAIRVGNPSSTCAHGTRGLTTLRDVDTHLTRRAVRLSYLGKGEVERSVRVVDATLAGILRKADDCDPHLLAWQDDGGRGHVTGASLNAFLQDLAGEDVHAHRFRSWQATVGVLAQLRARTAPDSASAASSVVIDVVAPVAERLGHTVATCRDHYVHHAVEPWWREGRLPAIGAGEGPPALDDDERFALAFLEVVEAEGYEPES